VDAIMSAVALARGRLLLTGVVPGAVAFWCLGVLAVGGIPLARPHPVRCAVPGTGIWCALEDRGSLRLAALVLLAILGILASTSLVATLTGPALNVVAGVGWPTGPALGWVSRNRISRQRSRRDRLLAHAGSSGIPARLAWYPASNAAIRPTWAGNVFAGLEQRVRRRHGLDLSTCWPLMEQVLPEEARSQLEAASRRLAGRIQNLLWILITLAWLPAFSARLAALIALAAIIFATLVWWTVSRAAEQYCALTEAIVAAHRHAMYRAVGWRPPASTAQEPASGQALTGYLNRLAPVGDIPLEWPDDRPS